MPCFSVRDRGEATGTPRRHCRARSGIAAVELAIVAPVLAVIFVASVDFARVFAYDLVIANCARNGALYGSQNPTTAVDRSGIQSAAQKDAGNLNEQKLTVTSSTDSNTSQTTVTVTVTYPFATVTNYVGVPSSITLTRTVQMSVVPLTPN